MKNKSNRKLTADQIRMIMTFNDSRVVSEATGVCPSTVSKIRTKGSEIDYRTSSTDAISDFFIEKLEELSKYIQ